MKQKEVDYLLKDQKINNKQYDNLITYNIDIEKEFIDVLNKNNLDIEIIKETLIEKEKLNK